MVFAEFDQARRHARDAGIEVLLATTSTRLRRRDTHDMAAVSFLINDTAHCVLCIARVTHLDARRVHAALAQLRTEANVRVVFDRCTRCAQTTTAHLIRA